MGVTRFISFVRSDFRDRQPSLEPDEVFLYLYSPGGEACLAYEQRAPSDLWAPIQTGNSHA